MERLKLIKPLNKDAMEKSQDKWNNIAKPLHSLGMLEDAVIKMSGIYNTADFELKKRRVIVMCADNGVVSEGVTQTGSEVTAIVAREMIVGNSSVNRLAKTYNAEVLPIDIGMAVDVKGVRNCKIAYGTDNIAKGFAMTKEQAKKSISVGIDMVRDSVKDGFDIIVTGEMGIGNTTTSSALASVILDLPVKEVTGRGAGLSDDALMRKIEVINRAIEVNKPDKNKPLELLSKLGGYDIAGIVGLFLGGAIYRIPIVIDGIISAVAAAIAVKIEPKSKNFMLCSHVSNEPSGAKMLEYLGFKPIINAGMFLGEGTGGIMLLPLLDGALSVYKTAHSFNELPIKRYMEL